jgi:glycosyltransferase involved in cell wall biosynthesis
MNFLELQGAIADVDVNLAPLQSSPFTFSKSELKFFEAALVETMTIASPTPVFAQVISDGVNGFLAGASEWASQLQRASALSGKDRKLVASRARQFSERTYTGAAARPVLEKLFMGAN